MTDTNFYDELRQQLNLLLARRRDLDREIQKLEFQLQVLAPAPPVPVSPPQPVVTLPAGVEQRKLTIEATYCKDWTVVQALREVLQNALDTKTPVTLTRQGEYCIIRDSGAGLKLSDFLLGRSSKSGDSTAMGQFGEGIKIAALVLSRNGRSIRIESGAKEFECLFTYDDQWQSSLLTINIKDGVNSSGTTVTVQCTEAEVAQASQLFLQLKPMPILEHQSWSNHGQHWEHQILEAPGHFYVNGILVCSERAILGYNFMRKELVNRDRSAVSHYALEQSVRDALAHLSTGPIIARLLAVASRYEPVSKDYHYQQSLLGNLEFSVEFAPNKKIWRRVIKDVFGRKVCLAEGNHSDDLALEAGWQVLTLPPNLQKSLREVLRSSGSVITLPRHKEVHYERLPDKSKENLKQAQAVANSIAAHIDLDAYPIHVFRSGDDTIAGHFNPRTKTVAVGTNILGPNFDLKTAVRVILHEYTHGLGHHDRTREFESDLDSRMTQAGLLLLEAIKGEVHVLK